MKLPFTRKGLEDHLDEIQRQQANDIQRIIAEQIDALEVRHAEQIGALEVRLAEEMNAQLDRRINDLQQAMAEQAKVQTELLFTQLKEEMNLQFHRRTNDLQRALIAQETTFFAQVSAQIGEVKEIQIKDVKEMVNKLKEDIDGKRVIVMPPTLDWHKTLFQRPQQLAVAYAKKENTTVFYLTPNLDDRVALAERISDGLWLVNIGYTKRLTELLNGAKQVIMSLTWTTNAPYVDQIRPDKLIYEYIDELELFDKYDGNMLIDHERLMSRASVTVCTATRLYDKAQEKARNPILSPNAGDYEFFAKTPEYEINPLVRDKVKNYRCVLGYYGALASWFDYDLVKEIARRHPEWLFILVGINYDGTLDKSGIDEFENIVYIPQQPYQELPGFLTAFDVAIIPFVINEITLSTSPVKLFEYMAGGKPILTSKMPECLKYESVRTYEDVDEFCEIVAEYMAMRPDDPYWETVKREALENTWDARTDQILEAISDK